MKKLLVLGFLTCLLGPGISVAQSAFDGTWKVDIDNAKLPEKPDVYLLQDGTYTCKTCVPEVVVKADGHDQKVTGHPYYDTKSVTVVDDHTIQETDKKGGKTVVTATTTVSADGKSAKFEFSDSSATNAAPVTGKGELSRVSKGPAGSHAISGSWRTTKMDAVSDNGLTYTYKVDGGILKMSTPTGQSFAAPLDGTEAPYKGDPGTSSVSVKTIDKNTIEETDKRNGKVISVVRSTVSADGKTMTIAVNDTLHGSTSQFTAKKL